MTRLLLALLVIAVWVGLTAVAAWAMPTRQNDSIDLAFDPHWNLNIPTDPVEPEKFPPRPTTTKAPPPAPRRVVLPRPRTQSTQTVLAQPVNGTCSEWIAAAGITDVTSAVGLINRESRCNPYAVNRSSGACGVAQEVPCGKSGCARGDGACQVRWMNSYVLGRYGSWAAALQFQKSRGWY